MQLSSHSNMEERGSDRRESVNHGYENKSEYTTTRGDSDYSSILNEGDEEEEEILESNYFVQANRNTAGNEDDDNIDEAGKSTFIRKLESILSTALSLKSIPNSHKCRGMAKEFINK